MTGFRRRAAVSALTATVIREALPRLRRGTSFPVPLFTCAPDGAYRLCRYGRAVSASRYSVI